MNDPGSPPRRGEAILAVDRNPRNLALLSSFLEPEGYRVMPTIDCEELEQALHGKDPPRLAVIDLAGFGAGIWECCEQLRAAKIPIVVVSPVVSARIQQESRLHGARAVLTRPIIMRQLLGLIHSLVGS